MPQKPKLSTSETPLAPIPSEILDQFVGQGPLSPEELDTVVRRFTRLGKPHSTRFPTAPTRIIVGSRRTKEEELNRSTASHTKFLTPPRFTFKANQPLRIVAKGV